MLTVIIVIANRVTKMPQMMHNDVTGDDLVVCMMIWLCVNLWT